MRKNRNTHILVTRVIHEMQTLAPELESDLVYIADQTIHPCRVVCSTYCATHPYQCATPDDATAILDRMIQADALVIGAPLYFRAPPAQFQAWAERLVSLFFLLREPEAERRPVAAQGQAMRVGRRRRICQSAPNPGIPARLLHGVENAPGFVGYFPVSWRGGSRGCGTRYYLSSF